MSMAGREREKKREGERVGEKEGERERGTILIASHFVVCLAKGM